MKKDVHFNWTSDMQKEFNMIKKAVAKVMQLNHCDSGQPVVIKIDVSLKGLSAVLLQNGKPVKFLSKVLTATEIGYANIKCDLLVVFFAIEKLHNYTFSRPVTVHTDYKPLESIFVKPISLALVRLQRMLLCLAKFDITVKYGGAKSVLLVDTLSRFMQPGADKEIPGLYQHCWNYENQVDMPEITV